MTGTMQSQRYEGTEPFVPQTSPSVCGAEIRGTVGIDVGSLSIEVVPPNGGRIVPLSSITFNTVNNTQPQIQVYISLADGSAIDPGYVCKYAFTSYVPKEGCA